MTEPIRECSMCDTIDTIWKIGHCDKCDVSWCHFHEWIHRTIMENHKV